MFGEKKNSRRLGTSFQMYTPMSRQTPMESSLLAHSLEMPSLASRCVSTDRIWLKELVEKRETRRGGNGERVGRA